MAERSRPPARPTPNDRRPNDTVRTVETKVSQPQKCPDSMNFYLRPPISPTYKWRRARAQTTPHTTKHLYMCRALTMRQPSVCRQLPSPPSPASSSGNGAPSALLSRPRPRRAPHLRSCWGRANVKFSLRGPKTRVSRGVPWPETRVSRVFHGRKRVCPTLKKCPRNSYSL